MPIEDTLTRVSVPCHTLRMAGKPEAFSAEENKVLRDTLRALRDEREMTQADVGRLLGIKQQNAGRLLGSSPHTGMGRQTANKLAEALGYRDAEQLLLERGALAGMKATPAGNEWHDRDSAVRIARLIKVDERAITNIVQRYTDATALAWPVKRWIARMQQEEAEIAADEAAARPPRPPRVAGTDEVVAPKRRSARKAG